MGEIISLQQNHRIASLKLIQKEIIKFLNDLNQQDLQYLSMSINCEIKRKSILIIKN
jgi:hypothetical protein